MVGRLIPSRTWSATVAAILLVATLRIETGHWPGVALAQQGGAASEQRPLVLDRPPARVLTDPNPVFRAVAIDTERGEVFMANDKESAGASILVYPTQFTPTDRIMEPRRRIAGPRTDLGMVCGIALSPQHGEMYTISGETGTLNVFSLLANGDVPPQRQLGGIICRRSSSGPSNRRDLFCHKPGFLTSNEAPEAR